MNFLVNFACYFVVAVVDGLPGVVVKVVVVEEFVFEVVLVDYFVAGVVGSLICVAVVVF